MQVAAIPDISSGAGSLAFAPDSHTLTYVDSGQLVCFGNVDWEARKAFSAHVKSFAFGPTGSTMAVAHDDGTLSVWSLLTMRSTHHFHVQLVSVPSLSADGRLMAGCNSEAELCVWDLKQGILSKKWRAPKNPQGFRTGVFAPDGKRFAAWQNDGVIRLWDVQAGKVLTDLPAERCDPELPPPVLIFQKDGNTLIAGGGHTVTFWDVSDTKP
jgi:katanin p80 WD40 repeat-containing subunit B1